MKQKLSILIKKELQTWKAPAELVARTKAAVARGEVGRSVPKQRETGQKPG